MPRAFASAGGVELTEYLLAASKSGVRRLPRVERELEDDLRRSARVEPDVQPPRGCGPSARSRPERSPWAIVIMLRARAGRLEPNRTSSCDATEVRRQLLSGSWRLWRAEHARRQRPVPRRRDTPGAWPLVISSRERAEPGSGAESPAGMASGCDVFVAPSEPRAHAPRKSSRVGCALDPPLSPEQGDHRRPQSGQVAGTETSRSRRRCRSTRRRAHGTFAGREVEDVALSTAAVDDARSKCSDPPGAST